MKRLWPFFFFLIACAVSQPPKPVEPEKFFSNITPQWFTTNPSHGLWDRSEKPIANLFYDIDAELAGNLANVIIITPENSSYSYGLDVSSGQRYYTHTFCPQKDILAKYSGAIWKPQFSVGVIPGHLDQVGDPQRVFVFGGAQKLKEGVGKQHHRIKLIGSVMHITCPSGNCEGKNNWLTRVIYLGVEPTDEKFGSVEDVEGLKKVINWQKTVAEIENFEGNNVFLKKHFSSAIVLQTFEFEAIPAFLKLLPVQNPSKEILKSCHTLYDKLWDEVGKEPNSVKDFSVRLRRFTQKYFPEIVTCFDNIYAGNINENPEKFWFLAQMGMYFRLHRHGHYFNCNIRTWEKNYFIDGKLALDLKQGINDCSTEDINVGMNYMNTYLRGLKEGDQEYYRFVEYDSEIFGSHDKLYSWVKMSARRTDCTNDPNKEIIKNFKIFPDDIQWVIRK